MSSESKMKTSNFVVRSAASSLVILLAIPLGAMPAIAQQQAAPSQPAQSAPATEGRQQGSEPQNTDQGTLPASPAADTQPQSGPAKPVGTAVAPAEKTMGVTASRPAGAVIAPAKQRRVRAILIKVGVIVGAGVAIGTVAALSRSSSSSPH
jgi:hypothetical protein